MPSRPPKPCGKPGCTKYATKKGRCDEHQIKHNWNHTKSSSERGYGAAWRRLRKAVLIRDDHLCQSCLRDGVYTAATEVDHIKPKFLGGGDTFENLSSVCHTCHSIKTRKEARQARYGEVD